MAKLVLCVLLVALHHQRVHSLFVQHHNGFALSGSGRLFASDGKTNSEDLSDRAAARCESPTDSIFNDAYINASSIIMPVEETTEQLSLSSRSSQSQISLAAAVGLLSGTYVISCVLTDLLANFEWVQTWRYLWPLVGLLYAADGLSEGKYLSLFSESRLQQISALIFGVCLVIGGAYDAFMPVWMTGPNVVTAAGIGQDAAAALFLLTLWQTANTEATRVGSVQDLMQREVVSVLPQVFLLAELYKLGEGSFDEIFSKVVSL